MLLPLPLDIELETKVVLKKGEPTTTFGSDFYSTTNYIYEPDQIQFSVSFNLARKNRKINLPQSEMVEKEF
jgi:hypothetical protein